VPFAPHMRTLRNLQAKIAGGGEPSDILGAGLDFFGSPMPGAEYVFDALRGKPSLTAQTGREGQQFAITRAIRGATALAKEKGLPGASVIPAGGIVPEQLVAGAINAGAAAIGKKDFQVSAEEPYAPTYIGRTLVDMLNNKEITRAEYEQAMYQQRGDVYDKALNRAMAQQGATNLTGMYTSLRPRQMQQSEPLIAQATDAHRQIEQYIKGSNADTATAQAIRDSFREKYPWYYAYAARYGDPAEREGALQTSQYYAASDKIHADAQKEIDAARTSTPIGAPLDLSAVYTRQGAQMAELDKKYPLAEKLYNPLTKTPKQQEEHLQQEALRAVVAAEPSWNDGQGWKDFAEYKLAHDIWQKNPQRI
ncbi:MAG: hypothetical protein KGJ80_22185, partial [Chloroflexota bacterium]|nr:hypothetical protein [Chloroflexota bacterium]